MPRLPEFGRSAMAFAIVAAAAACSNSDQVVGPPKPVNELFASYVSLGNSITAGYQSGGIMDSTQQRSYAMLLATQMNTRFAYPSLAGVGCPPPIANFQTQARVGGGTSTTCQLRATSSATINNVAVPGAAVRDLTLPITSASNTLTSLFLGGLSQVDKALQNNPTFASIWIGNNDVLGAALSGILVPVAGVSPGITPVDTFVKYYDAALTKLTSARPSLSGLLIDVVNVTNAPALFPTDSLRTNATFRAYFDAASGRVAGSGDPYKAAPLQLDPNCSTTTNTLLSIFILPQINAFRNDTNPTGQAPKPADQRKGHPPYIACGPSQFVASPVGQVFVLEGYEQAALAQTVAAYNAHIEQKANDIGWAIADPNLSLQQLRAAGAVPAIPNFTSATAPFGPYFSLDGVHPSSLAHVLLANRFILNIKGSYPSANLDTLNHQ
jgi:GDSL-like Lipase/Acylhydrolase